MVDRDPRRQFTKADHAVLYGAAGGTCDWCGTDLLSGWPADHVTAHSRGGPTQANLARRWRRERGGRASTGRRRKAGFGGGHAGQAPRAAGVGGRSGATGMSVQQRITGTSRLPDVDRLLVQLAESFTRTGMDATGILELLASWVDTDFADGDFSDEAAARFRSKLIEHRVDLDRIAALVRDPERFPHREEVDGPHYSAETAERMRAARGTVNRLLSGTGAPRPGTNKRNTRNDDAQPDTSTRITRQLNRDRPDLAEKVAAGELSANAAAIEAGYRTRKVSYRPNDPASVARSLRKHMSPGQLTELRELLVDTR